jgi:hypothetical protein
MKGMEREDEEFEMLLGEIPQATSPCHLNLSLKYNGSPKCRLNGLIERKDEQKLASMGAYEDFYQGLHGVNNLSSPSTISSSFPFPSDFSSPHPASCDSLSMNNFYERSLPRSDLDQRSQSQGTSSQQNNVKQEKQLTEGSNYNHGFALPNEQVFRDDQSLKDAFANLSFVENMPMKQAIQASWQNGSGGHNSWGLENGHKLNSYGGAFSAVDVKGKSVTGPFNGNGKFDSSTMVSSLNMHAIKYPSHSRNLEGNFRVSVNVMQPPVQSEAMPRLSSQTSYGPNTHEKSLGYPFNDFRMGSSDPHELLAICPRVPTLAPGLSYHILPPYYQSGTEITYPVSGMQPQNYMTSQDGSYVQCQQNSPPISALQHPINRMQVTWLPNEEDQQRLLQRHILLHKAQAQVQDHAQVQAQAHVQAQVLALTSIPEESGVTIVGDSSYRSINQQSVHSLAIYPQLEQPFSNHRQQRSSMTEGNWNTQLDLDRSPASTLKELSTESGNTCQPYIQGSFDKGESCSSQGHLPVSASLKDPRMGFSLDQQRKQFYPEQILTRNHSLGVSSVTTTNPAPCAAHARGPRINDQSCGRILSNGHNSFALHAGTFQLDNQRYSIQVPLENTESELHSRRLVSSQHQKLEYKTLEEVQGRIYIIAKDQHGCRFLQRKFDEGSPGDMQKIFLEIIDHIIELMTDPFGNYLVQKLLDACNEDQRMQIIHSTTGKGGELVSVSLNMHGTRAVQKLIETLKTPQQVSMVISALKPGVMALIKDLNGNHVVQRCLQYLSNEENQFLFDAVTTYCVEIASHRHGCCVLQRCIDFSTGVHRQHLVSVIVANALVLSQDAYGNYVVQYVLDLNIPRVTGDIILRLEGNYVNLSMQKFSSNVVEKCLKLSGEEARARLIYELINSSHIGQLLQDPYANYVVQRALAVSKGAVNAALVEAIRPNIPALRSSPFAKKILNRANMKK